MLIIDKLPDDVTPALRILILIGLISATDQTVAQSVPADLLELSVEDLLSMEIDQSNESPGKPIRPWTFSYAYHFSEFNDYLNGTDKVSVDDVLFTPGEEARTDKNFPVVPTLIEQEIHSLAVEYNFSRDFSIRASAPYVKQSTDHISIIPGYSSFNISSSGIGDVSLIGNYRFAQSISGHWQIGLGMSFPVGSIDEEGDTPRAPGKQQLPYTMQLGSGTYDVPAYIAFQANEYAFEWGVGLSGKLRLGENDREYRLGNRVSALAWLRLTTLSYIQPSLKLKYRYWGEIRGEDESLSVPGPFPYPAPVVDPSLFGGEIVTLSLGLKIPIFNRYRYIDLEFGKPVYQSLNGPQSSEDYRFSIGFSFVY
jgi:hypothetical protein